ncbi:nucleoside hydrolase [Leucobacter tardus]|uniref:Nucleoside hydrolase n=1 Tax=Leucobacter tardus TaxID=501483 RepID=A0A939QEG1_9MICO|nr:nucleoside hydrolase [Leucobacter tardus]MBO2990617.1 nucleoside hydrolase [Leucobacter tardus]
MSANPIPLFLDCDPGIDDAIALGYLVTQSDVEIVGVAASGGNVDTAQVVRNTQGWLALTGRAEVPLHVGAEHPLAHEARDDPAYAEETHGDRGCGYAALPDPVAEPHAVSAAQAWVDAARAHPGELIGVLVGPATNLALALAIEPELPQLMQRLFVMGGAFNYRGNTLPTTEWNVTYDPEAASQVFSVFGEAYIAGRTPHPPVIAPIEATEAVEMAPERLARILASDADADWRAVLHELGAALRFYFEFHEEDGHGYVAHIHDPYVLAAALAWARLQRDAGASGAPSTAAVPWAETAIAPVDVELTGTLTRGETVADWLGRWNRPANAEIIRRIDASRFLDHLTDTLTKGPHR